MIFAVGEGNSRSAFPPGLFMADVHVPHGGGHPGMKERMVARTRGRCWY